MTLGEGALYALIVGCEVAFWVLLVAGLACRYLLKWKRASSLLLLCVPLIDVALLAFTVLHLRAGAFATFAHGLATAYVAFTIAFGSTVIRWTDQHFAHRFASGPAPDRTPTYGWAAVLYELKLWGICLIAVCIVYVLLSLVIASIDEPGKTQALEIWYRIPLGTAFFWFLFGPLWSVVFFKSRPKTS